MRRKPDFKIILENIAFSNQLLKAARFLHFEKITPQPLTLKDERCLLLAPHPDDETFGCGGLLITYPENFDVVCMTDGRCGGYSTTEDENIATRKKEFARAIDSYGIESYKSLDIKDRKLIYNYEKFRSLEIENYDIIFLPNYFDQHKDHKAVTVLLQRLLNEKKHKPTLKLIFYELWSPLPLVNRILDITKIIDKKKEAVNIYESQHKYLNYLDGIVGLSRYRGMQISVGFAESYCEINIETFMKL